MTYGQLYREVWLELHPEYDSERSFKMADTHSPQSINKEIPPELVDPLRKEFLEIGRKVDAMSAEEIAKDCENHTRKN